MSGFVGLGGIPGLGPVSFNAATQAFSFGLPRSIGGIIPDCAIQESHSDRLVVTKHPVEKGANISDHAYTDPPNVNIRWGWTESLRGEAWAPIMYQQLLTLQSAKTPLDLFTGKRAYNNMVIESITEITDSWTEYALIVEIVLVNVIIVSTQATSIPAASQAQPQQTLSPQDAGHVGTSDAGPVPGLSVGSSGSATDLPDTSVATAFA